MGTCNYNKGRCGKPAAEGKTLCEEHLAKLRFNTAKLRMRRFEEGACIYCGNKKTPMRENVLSQDGLTYICKPCRAKKERTACVSCGRMYRRTRGTKKCWQCRADNGEPYCSRKGCNTLPMKGGRTCRQHRPKKRDAARAI